MCVVAHYHTTNSINLCSHISVTYFSGKKTSPEREKENFKLSYKSPPVSLYELKSLAEMEVV